MSTFEKYRGRGYNTLAVAMSYDPPAYVANFAESRKLPFGVAIDNTGDIARQFGDIRLTPTSVLINKRGEIVKRYVGAPDFDAPAPAGREAAGRGLIRPRPAPRPRRPDGRRGSCCAPSHPRRHG